MDLSQYRNAGEDKVKKIIAWFEAQGWQTKASKAKNNSWSYRTRDKYISRKKKHHTKIEWDVGSWPHAQLLYKTPNGGWSLGNSSRDLQALIDASESIEAPVLITKDSLPKALELGNKSPILVTKDGAVYHESNFRLLRIQGVVGLEKNGTISTKELFRPGETPWFHFQAYSHDNAHCEFISDGEVMHPLNVRILRRKNKSGVGPKKISVRKARVTSNVPPMLEDSTATDKQMVVMAIEKFFDADEKE